MGDSAQQCGCGNGGVGWPCDRDGNWKWFGFSIRCFAPISVDPHVARARAWVKWYAHTHTTRHDTSCATRQTNKQHEIIHRYLISTRAVLVHSKLCACGAVRCGALRRVALAAGVRVSTLTHTHTLTRTRAWACARDTILFRLIACKRDWKREREKNAHDQSGRCAAAIDKTPLVCVCASLKPRKSDQNT